MKLVATISYGDDGWLTACSVIGTKHEIVEHLFKLARENDTADGSTYVEYVLEDTSDDPYNPGLTIRSQGPHGERDFIVIAFLIPAVEL